MKLKSNFLVQISNQILISDLFPGELEADDDRDDEAARLQAVHDPDGHVHAAASHRNLRSRLLRGQRI